MNIGEKIKRLRTDKGMTQAHLAGENLTRNMISYIEGGKATPSLDTLYHIAKMLEVPVSYLFSEDDDLFFYDKRSVINDIKEMFKKGKYRRCVEIISSLSDTDDELKYILSYCYLALGKEAVLSGSLKKGADLLEKAKKYSSSTIYDTGKIDSLILIYSAVAENIQSPLLEFDAKAFEENMQREMDIEFYKYLIQDASYPFTNDIYRRHIKAKELIKNRRYYEAVRDLLVIEEDRRSQGYNAYVTFSIYTDIENCFRQISDFENAYRYASKRLALLEAFKS